MDWRKHLVQAGRACLQAEKLAEDSGEGSAE